MTNLGRLTQIKNIRSEWPDEARDFTPWLAHSDNLALLGETLGYGVDWLELVEREAAVGRFSADILCRDTGTDDGFVIIENQFGNTDNDHLGKLLTYAAGREAKTVIWIAEHLREEHRAALDLLNDATSDDYKFFVVEIELWRIAQSPVAPRFNMIAKPNEWARTVKNISRRKSQEGLSDLKKQYINYWTAFKEVLETTTEIRAQKASPQQWIYMALGRTNFTLTANVNSREQFVQAQLELHQDVAARFFKLLERDRAEIDAACPFPLSWEALPNRKGARIAVRLDQAGPTNEADWPRQHSWLVDKLDTLRDLLRHRIMELDLAEIEWETS